MSTDLTIIDICYSLLLSNLTIYVISQLENLVSTDAKEAEIQVFPLSFFLLTKFIIN